MNEIISSSQALRVLSQLDDSHLAVSLIDVRSENEFQLGHIPQAKNGPILNNEHRHLVGLTFKKEGQDRALKLGHDLVGPIKLQVVARWQNQASQQTYVYCWRGGLRSKISCEWLKSAGLNPIRIEGGYKALRSELLQRLQQYPKFLVLGGMTGSGKTQILNNLPGSLDLEGLAQHRGSAFGNLPHSPQPTQQNFENLLAMYFLRSSNPFVVEDESRNIGSVILPTELYEQMGQAPSVIVEESVDFRAKHIFQNYILEMSQQGQSCGFIQQFYKNCLNKIAKKLGGLEFSNIMTMLDQAFARGVEDPELHWQWIGALLEKYYDQMYLFSLSRKNRKILFRGNNLETLQFLKNTQFGIH